MTVSAQTQTRNGVEVRIEGLHRYFADVHALDGLDLVLHPGELVALLGPSGCGKTTALRIVAGLDEPDDGRVVVGDRDVTHVPANRRDMGMVFQAYSLFPHLTAQQNVEFGLKLRRIDRAKRADRAREMLDLVGLATQADRFANQLSGGQQQRVALARALAIQPSVLLLDEPLSALDAKVRAQLRDEIRRVQLEVGTTTLFVTHDQEEALSISDRVGVMSQGRLEQLAAPEQLYTAPATEFVAEFVGLMNRIPCRVADGQTTVLGTTVDVREGSVAAGSGSALVRPEQVEVLPAPGGTGRVSGVSFLGSITRVWARTADGHEVLAQANGADAAALAEGAPVDLRLTARELLVVPG
ncbi:MAG TPA: ABC transporter ATP-binding protein [Segeticoccus sp.]|nr:ABC transporter ATP-binding protein [Segeticoccus sp.]